MAFNSNAWGNDGGTYGEDSMRDLVYALSGGQAGVVGGTDALKVVQQSTPAATVRVNAGGFVIPATAAGETGSYTDYNDGYLTSPAFTPTGVGVSRKDRVILRVTAGVSAVEIVQGTAAASPTEPSITGDNYLELALVTLPASTSNITDAMITDRRTRIGTGPAVVTSTTRPGSPHEGQQIYETDTNRVYVYDGSTWQPVSTGRRFNGGLNTTALSGGQITIAHGLGATPTAVSVTLTSNNTGSILQVARPYIGGRDATNVIVAFVRSDTGAALGSETVEFMWQAMT